MQENDARQKKIQEKEMIVWPLLLEPKLVLDLLNKRMLEEMTREEGLEGGGEVEMEKWALGKSKLRMRRALKRAILEG